MVAFLNRKGKTRMITAAILIVALVMTYAMPMSVFATVAGSTGQIVSAGGTTSNSAVTISKTIAGTGTENQFDITLSVQTKNTVIQNKINAVLVIDTSGSMGDNLKLAKAKTAASSFVSAVLPNSSSLNKVGLVEFDSEGHARQALTNDSSKLNGEISKLAAGGATNLQDGIKEAQKMLNSADAGAKKYIVILSDGAPTYSLEGTATAANNGAIVGTTGVTAPNYIITAFNSDVKGNGKEYILNDYRDYKIGSITVSNNGIPSISQAIMAKNAGIEIYTVGCELADDRNEYPLQTNYKKDAVFTLTNCASGSNHFFDIANASNLNAEFQKIGQQMLETKAGKVVDPMGTNINFKAFKSNPNSGATYDAATKSFTWDLTKVTPSVSGNTYTYTMSYTVTLDTNAAGFVAGQAYDTNGTTTLTYLDTSGKEQTMNFKIPSVKGNLPSYAVTVKYFTKAADGEKYYLADHDQSLGLVAKGTSYGTAAASVKDFWYGKESILTSDYYEGVIQNPGTTVSSDNKTIEVIYTAKAKAKYTVEFYKDTETTAFATTTSAIGFTAGTVIAQTDIQGLIDQYRPAKWNLKGMDPASLTISTASDANNVIKVTYSEDPRYNYTVQYYYDGVIDDALTTTSADKYYEGTEISDIDTAYGKKVGYTLDHVAWVNGDSEAQLPLVVSEGNNVVKVYFAKTSGIEYKVKHFLQNDNDKYPTDPTETTTGAGVHGTILIATDYDKDFYGYQFNEVKSDKSVSIGEDGAVLNLYYSQVKAPLTIIHTYIGDSSLDKEIKKSVRIGSGIYETQSREYSFVLSEILVDGEPYEFYDGDEEPYTPSSYEGSMPEDESGMTIEFIYEQVDGSIQITRHYENLTTGTTQVSTESMAPTTTAINLIKDSDAVFGGTTYKLVNIVINSQIVATIKTEMLAKIEDLTAAKEEVADLYAKVAGALTDEETQQVEDDYAASIEDEKDALDAANAAYALKDAALVAERDAAIADEKAALDTAQTNYDNAVRALTINGVTVEPADTYDDIIKKFDKAIDDAQAQIVTLKTGKDYQDAVQAIIDADSDVIAAQDDLDKANADLDAAKLDPSITDLTSYLAAVDSAEEALEAAKAGVDTSSATTTELDAANGVLTGLKADKKAFEDAAAQLTEKTTLDQAKAAYETAKADAWKVYDDTLTASDEYKAKVAAQSAYDKAVADADKAKNLAIREVVKAKDADGAALVAELEAAEKALDEAQAKLDSALAREGIEDYDSEDLTNAELLALLGAYTFDQDQNYMVDVYYEYEATTPEDPEDPDTPDNPDRPKHEGSTATTVVIKEDDTTPASALTPEAIDGGDIEIVPTALPAGPLPKTGGVAPYLIYGFGLLLAGGGLAVRKKESKNK